MQATTTDDAGRRLPTWSVVVTRPIASVIPPGWRGKALVAIKGIHTVIFASVFAAAVARRIPLVAGSAAGIALVLNLRALFRRRAAWPAGLRMHRTSPPTSDAGA